MFWMLVSPNASIWLSDVGLELKAAKTRIGHTLEKVGDGTSGFDFLGFNIRQYQVSKYNSGKRMSGYKTLGSTSECTVRKTGHSNRKKGASYPYIRV